MEKPAKYMSQQHTLLLFLSPVSDQQISRQKQSTLTKLVLYFGNLNKVASDNCPAICLTATVFFLIQVSTACCCLFPCEGTPELGLLMAPGGGHLPGSCQALNLLAALQQLQCIVEFSKSAA